MKERTEDEILSKSPVKVTLGTAVYDLKPLPILKAREWRGLLTKTMHEIVSTMGAVQSASTLGSGLAAALINFPDKLAELVFAWSPDLPQQTILEEATEEQLGVAFSGVMRMAYPFTAQLALMMQVTKTQSR